MTTSQKPAPTITNAGTKPKVPHKLFVNVPVSERATERHDHVS